MEVFMPTNRTRYIGWGLLVGAAAGLVYTWKRMQDMTRQGSPSLINWDRVQEVAGRFCQNAPAMAGVEPHYAAMVERSVQEVAAYTGLALPSSALSLRILDRRQWLEANVANFRTVLEPLEELYGQNSSPRNPITVLFGSPVETFLSSQMGMLLGYLAQRVLGQYDIALLGREPLHDGQLYFVEPNIRGTQVQLGLGGSDFPMWVALHETTHAFEFEAHPWLRGHFNALLQAYLADLETEVDQIGRALTPAGLARLLEQLRSGESWLLWALTPHQRQVFDQMQALMCIVEGYSNHVMKQVGRQILPTFDLIEERVAWRQSQRTSAERLFIRLTGLEMKMEQYRLGEQFAEVVVQERDLAFLHHIWERAEHLPTLQEIGRPETWIARMEQNR
jgi:coenzyme F420 biosynthesis associated uncharacterized protein